MSSVDGFMTAVDSVQGIDDERMLAVIETFARAKGENIRLKRERERLVARIAQEDVRLAYA